MGGTNPYIEKADYERPTKPFTVTFIFPDKTEKKVQVDPDKIPYGETGQPGSILDIAMGNGLELEHVCGGVCACSTCHVMVKQGLETCSEGTDDEFDQLEQAPVTTLQSRLGCQCVPNGTKDVVVEIPAVSINLVKEGHGL
ncbi:MAG: 2Fe-2S iron-sulfur cluster binding domain-containing protein [Nitrospiraceae bacterium]|nr:2Fe-2S iron-sulfur cluster binding domain-containing protein [Nitrospiraceae bacterium]